MDSKQTEAKQASRYHAVIVTSKGYSRLASFDAESLEAACAEHVRLYDAKRTTYAIVLREGSTGRRYSRHESGLIRATGAAQ